MSQDLLMWGTCVDLTIKELAELIGKVVGYKGKIEYDSTKPDGTTRKLVDVLRIKSLGWKPMVSLSEGLETVYKQWKEL